MRSELYTADSSGSFRANLRGRGFRVAPALPPYTSSEYTVDRRPGRLPLACRVNGSGAQLHIGNADGRFFAEDFTCLDFGGAEAGDVYCVETFDLGEGVMPAGARQRGTYRVQASAAVATGTPASASDGWPVRPQTTALTFYASGTLQTARLWVRRLDGTWLDTLEDLDFASTPAITRYVDVPADRIALKAAAGTMNIAIDAAVEIG